MRNKLLLVVLTLVLTSNPSGLIGQTVMSQDFEGPISGVYYSNQWYRSCSGCIINGAAHEGYMMMDFAVPNDTYSYEYLLSPEFVKPNVPYFVSYWYKSVYSYSWQYFDVEVRYEDTYGYWHTDIAFSGTSTNTSGQWSFMEFVIPAGYYGYNQQLRFEGKGPYKLDDIKVTETSTIGISEEQFSNMFKIFPNPSTTGEINLAFASDMDNITIKIIDTKGCELFSNNYHVVANQNQKIVQKLPTGLYFLNISNNDYSYSQKIVVE